jgi:hypothetical protein
MLGPDSALAGLIAAAVLPLAGGNAERAVALKDRLKHYGLFARLGAENFFPTIEQAVDRYLATHPVEWRDGDETKGSR